MDVSVGTCYFLLHGGSEAWLRSGYIGMLAGRGPFRYTGGEEKMKPGLSGKLTSLPSSIKVAEFIE
jgi:hypothetical protein